MGIVSRIFGDNDLITKATDGVIKGVDAAVLTPEEKIQYHLDFLRAYEPFKLAQRCLALIVGFPYVLVWLLSAAALAASLLGEPCLATEMCRSEQFLSVSEKIATLNNDTLGIPFATILFFYFGGGAVEGIVEKRARIKASSK